MENRKETMSSWIQGWCTCERKGLCQCTGTAQVLSQKGCQCWGENVGMSSSSNQESISCALTKGSDKHWQHLPFDWMISILAFSHPQSYYDLQKNAQFRKAFWALVSINGKSSMNKSKNWWSVLKLCRYE